MDGGAGLRKRNKGGASTFESTAQDDVVERVARHVRHLDVYSNNKLSPEFKVQTEMGGQISLVGWVVTLVLFLGELSTYLTVSTHEHMVVDTTLGHKLRIDMNVTFPAITCAEVHLDAMDVAGDFHPYMEQVRDTGTARAAREREERAKARGGRRSPSRGGHTHRGTPRAQHLKKKRIDSEGKPVADAVKEEANVVEQAKADVPALDENYCGSCFGAETTDTPCCNTCAAVVAAYTERGWGVSEVQRSAEQCLRERSDPMLAVQKGEGCNLAGWLEVNKVAGNFHVALGEVRARARARHAPAARVRRAKL